MGKPYHKKEIESWWRRFRRW